MLHMENTESFAVLVAVYRPVRYSDENSESYLFQQIHKKEHMVFLLDSLLLVFQQHKHKISGNLQIFHSQFLHWCINFPIWSSHHFLYNAISVIESKQTNKKQRKKTIKIFHLKHILWVRYTKALGIQTLIKSLQTFYIYFQVSHQ